MKKSNIKSNIILSQFLLALLASSFIPNKSYAMAAAKNTMKGFKFQTAGEREHAERERKINKEKELQDRLARDRATEAAEIAERAREAAATKLNLEAAPAPEIGKGAPPPPPPPPKGALGASRAPGGWARVEAGGAGRAGASSGAGKVMGALKAKDPHAAEIAGKIAEGLAGLKGGRVYTKISLDDKASALLSAQRRLEGATKSIEREQEKLASAKIAHNDLAIREAESAITEARARIIKAEAEILSLTKPTRSFIVKKAVDKSKIASDPAPRKLKEAKMDEVVKEREVTSAEERVHEAEREGDEVRIKIAKAKLIHSKEELVAAKAIVIEEEKKVDLAKKDKEGELSKSDDIKVLESSALNSYYNINSSSSYDSKNLCDDFDECDTSDVEISDFEGELLLSMADAYNTIITDELKINYNTLINLTNSDNNEVIKMIESLKDNSNQGAEDFIEKINNLGLDLDEDVFQAAKDDSVTDKSLQALLYATSISALLTQDQRADEKKNIESFFKVPSHSHQVIGALTNAITSRMDSINPDFAASEVGVAAGDEEKIKSKRVWAMGLTGFGNQDKNDKVAGYKVRTLGGALGFDIRVQDNLTLGIAYSNIISGFNYTHSKSGDKIKAKTHALSLYGTLATDGGILWQNIASGLLSQIENTRENKKLNFIAKGKSMSKAISLESNLGYQIAARDLIFLPNIGLRYIHSDEGGYREKGAGAHNLTVTSSSSNSFTGVLGGKLIFKHKISELVELLPEVHASIEKELKNKHQNARVKFGWMNGYFENEAATSGNINNKISYNLGGGILLKNNNIDASIGYNYLIKKKYTAHQGFFKISVSF